MPAQHLAAGAFIAGAQLRRRSTACRAGTTSRRASSAAYDLFGNGKTAVKVSFGRYVGPSSILTTARANDPVLDARLNDSATRSWTRANSDYMPQSMRTRPTHAAIANRTSASRFDDPLRRRRADRNRPYNWQASAAVQHELRPGCRGERRLLQNVVEQLHASPTNQTVTAADFDSYCVTAADRFAPAGRAAISCAGCTTSTRTKFGTGEQPGDRRRVSATTHRGLQRRRHDHQRAARARRVRQGGMSTGRERDQQLLPSRTVAAGLVTSRRVSPVQDATAQSTPTARSRRRSRLPQLKLIGQLSVALGHAVSAVYQNIPGIPVSATTGVHDAGCGQSLGRPLSGNVANVTVDNIIAPHDPLRETASTSSICGSPSGFRLGGSARLEGNVDSTTCSTVPTSSRRSPVRSDLEKSDRAARRTYLQVRRADDVLT